LRWQWSHLAISSQSLKQDCRVRNIPLAQNITRTKRNSPQESTLSSTRPATLQCDDPKFIGIVTYLRLWITCR
jgi:hypothetical protein